MSRPEQKKQNFLRGTAVLAAATLIVKILGFLFKTPLNYIIGERGSSYFYNAYKVYDVLLMISTAGLPVAMSRMISASQAMGNYRQIRKIYRTSLYVFLTIGIIGSVGMLLLCKPLSVMVSGTDTSWAAIAALAPCVFMICLISSYRGFFQGQSNMSPTSVSQIFESILRLAVGLGAAWLLMKLTGNPTYGAAGGILGVTFGCLVSVLYLNRKFRASSEILSVADGEEQSTKQTMKELLSIAIPITIGAAGLQLINLLDTMSYMRRLTGVLGYTAERADTLNGIYSFQQTVFALPCAFIPTITISVIPAITAFLTEKNDAAAKATEESSIRTMGLIAFPCAAGLLVLSRPIVNLLCPGYGPESTQTGSVILAVLGIAVVFNSLVLLLNAIMQAHGNVTTPVINMLIGGAVKVVVNYFLVAVPELNIVGAPIGTVICYACITFLNVIAVRRTVSTKPVIFRNLIRPAAAAAIMGALTWLVSRVLTSAGLGGRLVCCVSILFALAVYFVLVVVLRCMTYEDCLLLPKGEKIAKLLKLQKKN